MFPSEKLTSDLSYSVTAAGMFPVKAGKTPCSFLCFHIDDSVMALVRAWFCLTPSQPVWLVDSEREGSGRTGERTRSVPDASSMVNWQERIELRHKEAEEQQVHEREEKQRTAESPELLGAPSATMPSNASWSAVNSAKQMPWHWAPRRSCSWHFGMSGV
eukprot:s885_g3.t1